ncbi:hypothetical protein INR49_010553 [Caranx melampygus]|nr:hypothetical protein INR49_010553 [Caranx melampygus]
MSTSQKTGPLPCPVPALCCVGGRLTFPVLPGGSSLEGWNEMVPEFDFIVQRSGQRRREFMKKLETVESSRPSCWEMVTCISLEGRRFSLKMATKVRRCRSVKTSRCFFGTWLRSRPRSSSLRLQAGDRMRKEALP